MLPLAVVSRFLALLSVFALVGGGALWIGWLRGARWIEPVRDVATTAALAVSATAVAGSLYYSEIVGFTPCRLCWFQRIGIYPMVVILAIARIRRRDDARDYVWALSALVAPTSIYHWALQTWPNLGGGTSCDPSAPCSVRWVNELGFVSIPFMALSTVIAVSSLVAVAQRSPTTIPSIKADTP